MKYLETTLNLLLFPLLYLSSIKRVLRGFFLAFFLSSLFLPQMLSAGSTNDASIGDPTPLNEGSGGGTTTFEFPVTVTKKEGTIHYTITHGTTDDSDLDITQTGTLVLPKNASSGTISILVNADNNAEPDETFNVIITAGTGVDGITDGTGVGTIVNDDSTQISYTLTTGSTVVGESVGTTSVPVRVDPAIYDDTVITVDYTTADNTALSGFDYTATNGTLSISAADTSLGSTIVSVPISIINDTINESQEMFNLTLSGSSITSTSANTVTIPTPTGDITINDDDGTLPALSVNNVTVIENDTTNFMTFTVSLSSILNQDVVFSYATYGVTATANVDFLPASGVATIPANTSNITISVLILGDNQAGEGDETLEFYIQSASSLIIVGKDIGIGTIQDDDSGLTLSLNDASIAEQDTNITADVKIVFSQALTADLNLTYFTTDNTAISPDDYNGTSNDIDVTIPAGSTEHTLHFTIVGDVIQESNEDFTITLKNISTTEAMVIAKDSGSVTIFDNDAALGCSSYIGLMTINEYQNNPNYKDDLHPLASNSGKVPGNFVEIKYLDFLVKQHVNDQWSLSVYSTSGSHTLNWDQKDPECIDPRYEVFQMNNNVMGKEGYVVLSDQNGNEVDVLNIDTSNHYAQKCYDFIYDTDFDSSAQNKDLFRDPDGTGDWFDHGSGANSGGSRCVNRDGSGGGLQFTKFDAIDVGVTPATPIINEFSVPIQTKIVNKAFPLDILSLEPSTGILTNSTIKVNTFLADGISGEKLPGTNPAKEVIFTNNTTVTKSGYSYGSAQKIVRLRFEYCGNDLGAYEDWDQCWINNDIISLSNRRVSHSRNAFAIRPDKFNVNIALDEILTAGEVQTGLSFTALDGSTATPAATPLYNEIENSSFTVDIKIRDTTKVCQNQDINMTPDVSFTDGVHSGDFVFHDVGDVNMTIKEIDGAEFALVDGGLGGDTPDTLRFIEPFNVDFTLIPDHFTIDVNLTDHNKVSNLTYLHDMNDTNDYSMGAVLSVDIAAMGADNEITRNYMETCYAKDTNLTLTLDTINITYPGTAAALTQFLYYNPVEDNGTADSGEGYDPFPLPVTSPIIITSLPIENSTASFPNNAPGGHGTTHIEYKLNFDRKQNLVVNPFKMNLTDIDIIDEDSIAGTKGAITNQNTNLYYARTRPSKPFYDDNVDSSTATPIAVDVYCDLGFTVCKTAGGGIDTDVAQLIWNNWWISLGHQENSTQHDGNVTLQIGNVIQGAGSPSVSPTNVQIITLGKDENVIVTSGATTFPMTVEVDLVIDPLLGNHTNTWLIYNENSAINPPDPFYKVRFINISDWAGVGETGYVLDTNASSRKTKRLDW